MVTNYYKQRASQVTTCRNKTNEHRKLRQKTNKINLKPQTNMFKTKLNIIDFYKSELISSFPIVMCLISRRADLPNLENEIHEYWGSLNSVTGENILFIFSTKTVKTTKENIEFEIPRFITSNKNTLKLNNYKRKNTSFFSNKENPKWFIEQEKQTNEMLSFFKLKETDIPCLHLTFVIPGFTYIINLNESSDIYNLTRSVIEVLESCQYENILNQEHKLYIEKQSIKSNIENIKSNDYFNAYNNLIDLLKNKDLNIKIKSTIRKILNHKKELPITELQELIKYLKNNLEFKKYYKQHKYDFKIIFDTSNNPCTHINIKEYYIELKRSKQTLNDLNKITNSNIKIILNNLNKVLKQKKTNTAEKIISTLELKPNIFGFGLNLNNILELLTKTRD